MIKYQKKIIKKYKKIYNRIINLLYKEKINNILLKDLYEDLNYYLQNDPSLKSKNEVLILNSFAAIIYYRISNMLYKENKYLDARIISEYAHSITGIDIHPGAQIQSPFFIDHGTGVVIGETCEIKDHVKLYQGVTLGAKTLDNVDGLKNKKRHPTILSNVTIYADSLIVGGDTIINENQIISAKSLIKSSK